MKKIILSLALLSGLVSCNNSLPSLENVKSGSIIEACANYPVCDGYYSSNEINKIIEDSKWNNYRFVCISNNAFIVNHHYHYLYYVR